MRHPSLSRFTNSRTGGVLAATAVVFTLGVLTGAVIEPSLAPRAAATQAANAAESVPAMETAPLRSANADTRALQMGLVYPIEVIRVIDGDTFEARVRVWPGLDVDTKVRLRGIDAAELHARCSDELAKAQSARTALETILAEGGVSISRVGIDKYGGRVDATVATRDTADVSGALLSGGYARAYDGGKRGTWCG